ncbi:hypothetical protein ACFL6X_02405 [Candidatus Latescibacterota bacterium]
MTRTVRFSAVAAILLVAAALVWAQPGATRGRPGGGMGVGVEQTLGFLALHPEVGLTDVQLVDLRAALRDSYAEQQEMREAMQSGSVDFQMMREQMTAFREDVMASVAEVLSDEQIQTFEAAMEQMQSARGQGRRRGDR